MELDGEDFKKSILKLYNIGGNCIPGLEDLLQRCTQAARPKF